MLTFLFYSGRSPFDHIIQFVTRSRLSHVATLVDDNVLYEAIGTGWHKLTGPAALAHAAQAVASVVTHPSDPDDLAGAIAWAEAELGTPYSWEADLGLAFGVDFSRAGICVCSTGAAEIAVRAGVLVLQDTHAETPASLARLLGAA